MTALELACGPWRAQVLPGEGANLARLAYRDQDVLRSREAALHAGDGLPLYGSPVLFPANRIRDGMFTFRGRTYRLPVSEPARRCHLHGLVMGRAFRVLEAGSQRALCRYVSGLEDYPFRFSLTVSIVLSQQGVTQQYLLENLDRQDFPVVFGLHTTFSMPDFLQIPLGPAWERDARFLPGGLVREPSSQEMGWVQGIPYRGEPLSGLYQSQGRMARIGMFTYRVSGLFDHWILYGGGGRDYVCVEPQAGQADGLNCPGGHLLVPKGGSLSFCTTISRGSDHNG